jgi:hypothetical protein
VFAHQKNLGYGANQKTCYTEALRLGADVIVMVHPDYQYDPRLSQFDHLPPVADVRTRCSGDLTTLSAVEVGDCSQHAALLGFADLPARETYYQMIDLQRAQASASTAR